MIQAIKEKSKNIKIFQENSPISIASIIIILYNETVRILIEINMEVEDGKVGRLWN